MMKTNNRRNNIKPSVLMTTLGRSHFIVAADALVRQGANLKLMQGWVPRNLNSWLVKICARIVGRKSFVAGLAKRRTPALEGRIICEPMAEWVYALLSLTVGKCSTRLNHLVVRIAFAVHGWTTRRHLKNFEVFHVKSGLGGGGAIRKAKRLGLKVLVDHCTPHPYFMGESCGSSGYFEPWTFWAPVLSDCDEADLLMVGSEFIKDTFIAKGYPPQKIRVAPLGILTQFYGAKTTYNKDGILNLIYTGAWKYDKGAAFLVEALALLREQDIECHLSVFGSYNANDDFVIRGRSLPITLHGHVPQDELRQHLANADLYVFPSLADGFAVSAIEAMAAGLCIVTTKESSLKIDEGVTGFIVPARSSCALAERIAWLSKHRNVLETVGKRAASMVRNTYTWEKYAMRVDAIYNELTNVTKPNQIYKKGLLCR